MKIDYLVVFDHSVQFSGIPTPGIITLAPGACFT